MYRNILSKILFGFALLFLLLQVQSLSSQTHKNLRLLPLVPGIHEMIYELGLGQFVIARSKFSTYPDSSLRLPSVGGLYDVNQEAILRLHPDMVFTDGSQVFKEKQDFLKKNGIQIVELPTNSLEDVYKNLTVLGEMFGIEARASFLIHRIRDSIAFYADKIKSLNDVQSSHFLLVIGRNPGSLSGIYVAGKSTFLSDIFESAGLVNAMEREGYFQVNLESLLRRKVEMIIEIRAGADEDLMNKMIKDWVDSAFSFPRIRRIIGLNGEYVAIPGPRVYLILKEFYEKWKSDVEK